MELGYDDIFSESTAFQVLEGFLAELDIFFDDETRKKVEETLFSVEEEILSILSQVISLSGFDILRESACKNLDQNFEFLLFSKFSDIRALINSVRVKKGLNEEAVDSVIERFRSAFMRRIYDKLLSA